MIVPIIRRVQAVALVAGLLSTNACYTYAAVPTSRSLVQEHVELHVSDVGRVQLRELVGTGTRTVEGRVLNQDDAGWRLQVSRVTALSGDASTWSGEVLFVSNTSVDMVRLRSFDRQRTMLATGATVGVVALFVLSRNLLGFGDLFEGGQSPPPPAVDIRY